MQRMKRDRAEEPKLTGTRPVKVAVKLLGFRRAQCCGEWVMGFDADPGLVSFVGRGTMVVTNGVIGGAIFLET